MAEPNTPPPGSGSLTFTLAGLMFLVTVSAILVFLLRGLAFDPAKYKVFFIIGMLILPFCAILCVTLTLKLRKILARRKRSLASRTAEPDL